MPNLQNVHLTGRPVRAKLGAVDLFQLADTPAASGASRACASCASPWAAPEVLAGGPCTTASDIYSLGCVMWEVVTHVSELAAQGSSCAQLRLLWRFLRCHVEVPLGHPAGQLLACRARAEWEWCYSYSPIW